MQSNPYIKTLYPTGQYLPSAKYKNKQCGEYLNDNFLETRQISSSYDSKKKLVDKFGFKRDHGEPMVGDIVVMDYETAAGHIAIINTKDFDVKPRKICLTDCNLKAVGVVNNDFWIEEGDKNWKRIYGFARLKLNEKAEANQPKLIIPDWAKLSVEKARAKGVIEDWSNPNEVVGSEKMEWVFEKLGKLQKDSHEGKLTLLRLAVMLDKMGLLEQ